MAHLIFFLFSVITTVFIYKVLKGFGEKTPQSYYLQSPMLRIKAFLKSSQTCPDTKWQLLKILQ